MAEGEDNHAKLLAALDIMQRMPPSKIVQSLTGLLNLIPEETDELLQRIDQPLTENTDAKGCKYLLVDYNRDGDSFRSPWTNEYDPPIDEGLKPSKELRDMEVEANKVFALYASQYYGANTVTSVYFWELDGKGFASVWLVKKGGETSKLKTAVWDAIHVMQVLPQSENSHKFQLTSTVMVSLGVDNENVGDVSLSGSYIQQRTKTASGGNATFIPTMGEMIEKQETKMKGDLQEIYFNKMQYVMEKMRKSGGSNMKLAGLAQKAARKKRNSTS